MITNFCHCHHCKAARKGKAELFKRAKRHVRQTVRQGLRKGDYDHLITRALVPYLG